jgi:hypothetical protein
MCGIWAPLTRSSSWLIRSLLNAFMTDEESYWTCIEEAFDKVDIYVGGKVFLAGFHQYPNWIGDLLAAHWLLSEFDNGGLMQFFLNSTGVLAPEAIAGFRRMGLSSASDAITQAVAVFGAEYPRDNKVRDSFLRAKLGLKPDDKDYALFKSGIFEPMGELLCQAGGEDLDAIYDRMNEYAKEHEG